MSDTKRTYTRADIFKGGPGLCGYAYQADIYCEDCARSLTFDEPNWRWDWIEFCDSERVLQPVFFGESDYAVHCATCSEYLYGPKEEN